MTDAGSEAVLAPSGSARRAARRPRGRVRLLLAGVAVLAVGGVQVVLGQGSAGPVVRTVTVGPLPYDSLTVDHNSPTVTVVDARTGIILRHLAVCGGPFAVGMSERTGHLFAKCNDDGTTDMLDARTGRVLHRNTVNSGTYCGVLVDESTNRVFETGNGVTDLLDAQTGMRLKGLSAVNSVDCVKGFAVNDRTGLVYASLGGINGANSTVKDVVVVVNGRTGAILRRFPVPANPISLAVDSQTGRVLVGSAGPLDSSGIPTTNGTVSVLDGTTGRMLRTLQVGFTPTDITVDEQHRRALVVSG